MKWPHMQSDCGRMTGSRWDRGGAVAVDVPWEKVEVEDLHQRLAVYRIGSTVVAYKALGQS